MKKLIISITILLLLFICGSCSSDYTLTYYVDDQVYSTIKYSANEEIKSFKPLEKEDYLFECWTLKDGTPFDETKMPQHNLELYAKYVGKEFTLTYYLGKNVFGKQQVNYNSDIELIDEPVKPYHNFLEWRYVDGTKFDGEKMPNHDLNLYAAFEELDSVERVVINLSDGRKIYIDLYPDIAPKTVENFLRLVDMGYYTNIIFHRVIKDFMIQTGYFRLVDNKIVTKPKVDPIVGEFDANGFYNPLKHEVGVISMARTSVMNSANSQFFICTADSPHLDGQYAAFGRVCDDKSLEVVLNIGNVNTFYINDTFADFPIVPVVIDSIERA